ncbi:Zn(II)2Cys6 transcription factor domain-containing protein ASCRUDRAFT_71071 [Ascoidea rubescens DSM 1968]|uniref:Zn(2)-C6 fungal-type domain-containing protein n=1 Tax=Ascoidea rubescens DSM 1968 TaxID=1344418 RepID=A0A1D2VEW4_9ASCO|nr:hypothetical protein ASCRUDRAFT_71071 [Ascoidea rubescens DSM 1968]ODV60007.1 hypothetical protein ASCRUDRAFT_71071 [Ascoidea rubescens DSM 1968]
MSNNKNQDQTQDQSQNEINSDQNTSYYNNYFSNVQQNQFQTYNNLFYQNQYFFDNQTPSDFQQISSDFNQSSSEYQQLHNHLNPNNNLSSPQNLIAHKPPSHSNDSIIISPPQHSNFTKNFQIKNNPNKDNLNKDNPKTPQTISSPSNSIKKKKKIIRKRSSTACQTCRLKKIKCDNEKPQCGSCKKLADKGFKITCIYNDSDMTKNYSTFDHATLNILTKIQKIVDIYKENEKINKNILQSNELILDTFGGLKNLNALEKLLKFLNDLQNLDLPQAEDQLKTNLLNNNNRNNSNKTIIESRNEIEIGNEILTKNSFMSFNWDSSPEKLLNWPIIYNNFNIYNFNLLNFLLKESKEKKPEYIINFNRDFSFIPNQNNSIEETSTTENFKKTENSNDLFILKENLPNLIFHNFNKILNLEPIFFKYLKFWVMQFLKNVHSKNPFLNSSKLINSCNYLLKNYLDFINKYNPKTYDHFLDEIPRSKNESKIFNINYKTELPILAEKYRCSTSFLLVNHNYCYGNSSSNPIYINHIAKSNSDYNKRNYYSLPVLMMCCSLALLSIGVDSDVYNYTRFVSSLIERDYHGRLELSYQLFQLAQQFQTLLNNNLNSNQFQNSTQKTESFIESLGAGYDYNLYSNIEFNILSGMHKLYIMKPLDAWKFFLRASETLIEILEFEKNNEKFKKKVLLELFQGNFIDNETFNKITQKIQMDNQQNQILKERLYWSCIMNECEFRTALSPFVATSGIVNFQFSTDYYNLIQKSEKSISLDLNYNEENDWITYVIDIHYRNIENKILEEFNNSDKFTLEQFIFKIKNYRLELSSTKLKIKFKHTFQLQSNKKIEFRRHLINLYLYQPILYHLAANEKFLQRNDFKSFEDIPFKEDIFVFIKDLVDSIFNIYDLKINTSRHQESWYMNRYLFLSSIEILIIFKMFGEFFFQKQKLVEFIVNCIKIFNYWKDECQEFESYHDLVEGIFTKFELEFSNKI